MKKTRTRITVALDPDTYQAIRAAAFQGSMTHQAIIFQAVKEWLARNEVTRNVS